MLTENESRRKRAVESQYNRNQWELDDKDVGRIRINTEDLTIIVFPIIEYARINGLSGAFTGNLSKEEAEFLEKLFFGKFKPNKKYLKRISNPQ